jgi:copper ion binding protein
MCNACNCGTNNTQASAVATGTVTVEDVATSAATVDTYTVVGMTCGHCVSSVSAEVGRIDGVTSVDVDLPSGAVTIASDKPLDRDTVRAAVEEAGYQLAPN